MIRKIFGFLIIVHAAGISYGQKVEYKLDEKFKDLYGGWVNDSTVTALRQRELGIVRFEMKESKKNLKKYTELLVEHLKERSINGFVSSDIKLRYVSSGDIVFYSYKRRQEIPRKTYCGIFWIGDNDYFVMFTDLEDEGNFKAIPFTFTFDGQNFAITNEELGKFGFKKK